MSKFSIQDCKTNETFLVTSKCTIEESIIILQNMGTISDSFNVLHQINTSLEETSISYVFDDYVYDHQLNI